MRLVPLLILMAALASGAPSPETTAKRSKADIERTLKAIEATARGPAPSGAGSASHPDAGKRDKGQVILAVTPSELAKARVELARLNAYRYLSGLNSDVQLKDEWNLTCKYAAHLCDAIGRIEHTPSKPPGMDDAAYKRGYEGTSHSNLSWTTGADGLTGSVDGYMDDSDPGNVSRVGHRRWCLNPSMRHTGFGVVRGSSAMWSMDGAGGEAPGAIVCFPAAGFHPLAYYKPGTAWSVSLDPGRFQLRAAQVKVFVLPATARFTGETGGLSEVRLGDVHLDTSGVGITQCVIFRPDAKVLRGARYGVLISGVEGLPGGKLAYTVEFF